MSNSAAAHDARWMRAAISLARRGMGNTAPNPSVGCIILKSGKVVGRGWTQPGGRPHAEAKALDESGANAAGATAYVTLEPCAHTGQTAPCAGALVKAGVSRVIVACTDPDPRVAGKGIAKLRDAGIEVALGCLEAEATRLNAGFFSRLTQSRPYITLKTATTLDGKIALSNGESKWITGEKSRQHGHMLRAQHDAILTGVGTVLADDPELTCRIEGLEAESPKRIILDSDLKTPPQSKIIQTASDVETIVISEGSSKTDWLEGSRIEHNTVESLANLNSVVKELSGMGINRLLVEAGAKISASFLRAGIVDEICHYSAGKVIGADGLSAMGEMLISNLPEAPHFMVYETKRLGDDTFVRYSRTKD